MTALSEERLVELEALEKEAATTGPLSIDEYLSEASQNLRALMSGGRVVADNLFPADARRIAAACNWQAALIAEVRRQAKTIENISKERDVARYEVGRLEAEVAKLERHIWCRS